MINYHGDRPAAVLQSQVIKDLAIPIRDGYVTYHETFLSCVRRVLDADNIEDEEEVWLSFYSSFFMNATHYAAPRIV